VRAPSPRKSRTSARSRFVVVSVAVSLALAWLAPPIARTLGVAIETAIFGIATLFTMIIGWWCARAFESLERCSREDPVTRVGNRRHYEEQLAQEVQRANRSRMPLSVVLLDIDHLKKLNDAHGHACGDRALALVGEVLLATCRSRDVAARLGGDEFAVVLPRTRASEAKAVATRIRAEVAERRGELGPPLDALLSVSIGIADFEAASDHTMSALVEAADQALYIAKTQGRDRIAVKEPARISGVIRLDEVRAARSKGRAIS